MAARNRFHLPKQLAPKRIQLAVFLLLLAAIGLLLVFLVTRQFWRPKVTTEAFWSAYRADNAKLVQSIYDEAKTERDEAEKGSERQLSGVEVVRLIETTIADKARGIIEGLAKGEMLAETDKRYLSTYNALSAQVVLDSFLKTAYGYLQGEMSDPEMQHFLEQSLQIDAIYVTYARIGLEFPAMVQSRAKIAEAETAMRESRWHDATLLWQDLADDEETSHFTQGLIKKRAEDARASLRSETIRTVNHNISQGRLYSAQEALKGVLDIFPFDQELLKLHQELEAKLPREYVEWDMAVDYIAVRPLIADAKVAFDGDAYAEAADRYLLLTSEFTRMLDALNQNDYVLVSPKDFINKDGTFKNFPVPAGKTPLVLVLDSYHFAPTRLLNGTATRLALDESGNVSGVVLNADGTERLDPGSDAIGLLESYLAEHQDFAFNGAKGIIAVNGSTGVFGMITGPNQALAVNQQRVKNGLLPLEFNENTFEKNRTDITAVADRLKATGWLLAANSTNDKPLPESTVEEMMADNTAYKGQVESLIGTTDIYVYPGGEHVNNDDEKTSLLVREGFHQFLAYGTNAFFAYGEGYVHIDMTQVGGAALRDQANWGTGRFFDGSQIIDNEQRTQPVSE